MATGSGPIRNQAVFNPNNFESSITRNLDAKYLSVGGGTVTGALRVNGRTDLNYVDAGNHLEVQATGGNTYLDFHSNSGSNVDFDSRIISIGGQAGQVGQGRLAIQAAQTGVNTTSVLSGFAFQAKGFGVMQPMMWRLSCAPGGLSPNSDANLFAPVYSGTANINYWPSTAYGNQFGLNPMIAGYSGMLRVPVSGVYSISVAMRFADSASAITGFRLQSWNGTTFFQLIPDVSFIVAPDQNGRRCGSYSDMHFIQAGEGISLTVMPGVGNQTVVWAVMCVTLVYAP
jgi:hypothetical protein